MNKKQFQQIFESLEFDTRPYSGRAMYGKQCLGVTCENPIQVILDAINEVTNMVIRKEVTIYSVREFVDMCSDHRTDSMGLDSILYFPNIQYSENTDDDEEYAEDEENDEEE